MSPQHVNHLVSATTRYVAGRNAMQTSYWRTGTDGKLMKYNKTCEFSRKQNVPANIKHQYHNRSFLIPKTT